MHAHRSILRSLSTALMLVPALVMAQAAGPAAGAAAPGATATGPGLPRELGKPQDDIKLDVQAFQVDGLGDASATTRAGLAAVTAPYTGKERSYEDLINAVAAVTRYMQRQLGCYVGLAYLPEQSVQGGVVHIYALEGRLGEIKLIWPDDMPVSKAMVERRLTQLKPGEVLREREVERAVFLINDLPGVRARFEVEPGEAPGTANLIVTAQAEARPSARIEADTLGSHYSGTGRVSGQAGLNSPLGQGDVLNANVLGTVTGGLLLANASYVLPVGADGWKLGGSLSRIHYQLDKDIFADNLHGSALAANAFALYPLVRSRNLNVFSVLTYEHKRFDDRRIALDTLKKSQDWSAAVLGDFRDTGLSGAINTYEATWLHGHIDFAQGAAPSGVASSYSKLSLGASRLQNLISGRLLLYARYKGQIASRNLDVTERYSVGGPAAVRAYAPGEATADTGHVLNTELRFLPPDSWFGKVSRELALRLFYDWGHARFSHDSSNQPAGEPNAATLSGFGLGATWERAGDFAVRLDLAWRGVGHPQEEANRQIPRANAVLSKTF